jgi:hypothetical protein
MVSIVYLKHFAYSGIQVIIRRSWLWLFWAIDAMTLMTENDILYVDAIGMSIGPYFGGRRDPAERKQPL